MQSLQKIFRNFWGRGVVFVYSVLHLTLVLWNLLFYNFHWLSTLFYSFSKIAMFRNYIKHSDIRINQREYILNSITLDKNSDKHIFVKTRFFAFIKVQTLDDCILKCFLLLRAIKWNPCLQLFCLDMNLSILIYQRFRNL